MGLLVYYPCDPSGSSPKKPDLMRTCIMHLVSYASGVRPDVCILLLRYRTCKTGAEVTDLHANLLGSEAKRPGR